MQKLLYILFLGSFLLSGCENNDLLQSEKKVRSEIENSNWKRLAASSQDYHEIWTFKDGTINIIRNKKSGSVFIDSTEIFVGNYAVSTKTSSSYISFSNIPDSLNLTGFEYINLNLKWTIAEINDKVMYLSAATEAGTIRSLEYIKQ